MYKKLSIFSIIVIIIDQLLKYFISNSMNLYEYKTIIKDFFYITHVHNTGAAWSILSGNTFLLIAIAFIAFFLIIIFFIKDQKLNNLDIAIYSLLIGGIIGNLIDRIIYGYVIDYLDFIIFKYDFPVFNLADICIVLSVILLIIKYIKEEVCEK